MADRRPASRRTASDGSDAGLHRNSLLIVTSSVLIGIGNYGFSLVLVWLLSARAFSVVASVNALVIVVGTAGAAALPWLVAREVARHPPGSSGRREAIGYALVASMVLGAVTTAIVLGIASTYAGQGVLIALGITTMGIFIGAIGQGFLQGSGRFGLLASIGVVEVGLKVGLGAGLAAAGFGATGAVAGAAAGGAMLAVAGLSVIRRDLALPRHRVAPELWRQMLGIAGIQVGVSVLVTLDVIVGSVVDGPTRAFAHYQAMLVFARVPLFVSTAVSIVVFPRLVTARGDRDRVTAQELTLFLIISAAGVAIVSSLPSRLLELVLPKGYSQAASLLVPLAFVGLAVGIVNLVTTFLQARGVFWSTLKVLIVPIPLLVGVEALVASSVTSLAWAAAIGDLALATAVTCLAARHFAGSGLGRRSAIGVLAIAVACALLRLPRPEPVLWTIVAVAALLLAVVASGPRARRPGEPRILFLIRPRSAGTEARWVHAVARGMVNEGLEVTVACSSLARRSSSVMDGVRYDQPSRQVGARPCPGDLRRLLGAARLIRQYRPDLVVEELGSSSMAAAGPWLTRRPAAAVAAGRPGEVLRLGNWVLAPYQLLISTSDAVAEALRRRRPTQKVASLGSSDLDGSKPLSSQAISQVCDAIVAALPPDRARAPEETSEPSLER